jgi:hypothetical protein
VAEAEEWLSPVHQLKATCLGYWYKMAYEMNNNNMLKGSEFVHDAVYLVETSIVTVYLGGFSSRLLSSLYTITPS